MKKIRKIDVPQKDIIKKLRMAAYCRVSTKYESQKGSIELQKQYYESYIKEQPNWLFAGVYVDYGSRGRIVDREQFQKMIQKAVNGGIDCIITKSISRFSGNTVNMLQTIHLLKEKGVTVWFEKENIRSTDKNAERAITIFTMLAQEEIRNMSENIQWGFKRRFEQGVNDSHQGIISREKFLEVACEMNRRKSKTINADGNMVKRNRKYNPHNILGNILECEECGATYRRRTERGKVVYRCATRIEKGRDACRESPTIEEEWIKTELGKNVCEGEYDEEVVREKVDKVLVGKDGKLKILFV